ncbi:TetR/AcrR family transcriptional regulator [Faecalicatena orotica]|uniref:TetR family transcriptional regulator n=1 Tax=Faecalicatena orotica TaxID=1544 RepID=A0A2Y9BFV8_9FIRM|nr:TetR/AcrR family transcriptional regulator [Faecalicatena orotica]PWJ30179.1 TetR family transcriptional regulator [Faecalicatena orotica]SSA55168.1 transcriptional regulator, TetR family [Faecalicatena orotica]
MAGNKFPEITEKMILDTAKKLFLENGYEKVTLQGIADACGLTRGAIYHHFRGKEEMLDAVTAYMFNETTSFYKLKEETSLNGLEKLQKLLIAPLFDDEQIQMYSMLSQTFYKSPKLVSAYLLDCQNSVIPMTQVYIEEGIIDGSIKCEDADVLAEIITVFFSIWLSPMIFNTTKEKFLLKLKYIRIMLESVGLDLMDDEMARAIEKMCDVLFH